MLDPPLKTESFVDVQDTRREISDMPIAGIGKAAGDGDLLLKEGCFRRSCGGSMIALVGFVFPSDYAPGSFRCLMLSDQRASIDGDYAEGMSLTVPRSSFRKVRSNRATVAVADRDTRC